jgi:hypothetical protein
MITKIAGDTIVFEANLTDSGGTAITNAAATITVVDAVGSTVLSATATHIASGTYQRGNTTTGWGNGPITEYWKFTNSAGTLTEIVGNKFRIIGTSTLQPYVWPHELYTYYENIESYFDGSELERVYDSFNFINQQLLNLGYDAPVRKGTSGYYDQSLRDWNAWDSIYRIVMPRAISQSRPNDEGHWFDYYKNRSNELWNKFRKKEVVLNVQTSPGEVGIMAGTKVSGTLFGQMETNWEGYGKGFLGADYPRTWRVEMTGTGTEGGLTEGTFRWSKDNGISWCGTNAITDTNWIYLADEVYVRFHRGTYTGGTTGMWTTSDVWTFRTAPLKISTGGRGVVKSVGI